MITEQVNKIIEVRKNSRIQFESLFNKIEIVKAMYGKLISLSDDKDWNILCQEYPDIHAQWEAVLNFINENDFERLLNSLIKETKDNQGGIVHEPSGAIKNVLDRIVRDYVKICVMGCWKNGKSTLLQTLTGLGDNIIPTSAEPCTGTNTTFISIPENESEYALVYFYTFEEMCKTINDNIVALGLSTVFGEFEIVGNETDYIKQCKEYNKQIASIQEDGEKKEVLKHLKELLHGGLCEYSYESSKLYSYRNYLSAPVAKFCLPQQSDDLRKFISYFGKTNDINVKTDCVLGVKKVEVYFHLKIKYCDANGVSVDEYVPNIQFIDTVGLGEPRVGIERILQDTIREESDIAIAVRKVVKHANKLEKDDIYFHDQIREIISGRKPDKWIYYLLNIFSDVNEDGIRNQRKKLFDDLADANKFPIKLNRDYMPAINVKDEIEVIDKFLYKKVLLNLEQSIVDLDDYFLKKAESECVILIELYRKIVGLLGDIKIQSLDINEEKYKDNEINKIVYKIINEFAKTKEHWTKRRDQDVKRFEQDIDRVVKSPNSFYLFRAILGKVNGLDEYRRTGLEKTYEELKNSCIRDMFKNISKTNLKGRELATFIENREKLLDEILSDFVAYDDNWLKDCEKELKRDVGEAVRKSSNGFSNMVDPILTGSDWLKSFEHYLSDKHLELRNALGIILNANINLNDNLKMIWDNSKLEALVNVKLDYCDRITAASSFFNSLEGIEKSIKTIIPNSIRTLLDSSEPYESFIAFIENAEAKLLTSDINNDNMRVYQDLIRFLKDNFNLIVKDVKLRHFVNAVNRWNENIEDLKEATMKINE